ncbi:hypothetical protein RhiirA4_468295 [Rhizophagus irregularis]|uniref:Uncharacterized protein n=1 Tax=Rhizophagus irregularis TaxID=588596 RepID=A0A2I1GXG0_9GLOM|nr:hypothetical protein RhiirA4_468295 [Rhizophagus irregularis]
MGCSSLKSRIRQIISPKATFLICRSADNQKELRYLTSLHEFLCNDVIGKSVRQEKCDELIEKPPKRRIHVLVELSVLTVSSSREQELLNRIASLKESLNKRVEVLRQQLRNNRNQNLRIQRLLNESQGERDLAILTYYNERDAYGDCQRIAQQRQARITTLLQEKFAFRLLSQLSTMVLKLLSIGEMLTE